MDAPAKIPVANLFSLNGRRGLITGGSMGIGACLAEAFSELGASVAIAARDLPRAEAKAAEIAAKTGGKVKAYRCDVANGVEADEMRFTGAIVAHLEVPRIRLRTKRHHPAMPFAEQIEKLVRCSRYAGHLPAVGHDGIRAEDVVTVSIPSRDCHTGLDNPSGLVKFKLRSFDIV